MRYIIRSKLSAQVSEAGTELFDQLANQPQLKKVCSCLNLKSLLLWSFSLEHITSPFQNAFRKKVGSYSMARTFSIRKAHVESSSIEAWIEYFSRVHALLIQLSCWGSKLKVSRRLCRGAGGAIRFLPRNGIAGGSSNAYFSWNLKGILDETIEADMQFCNYLWTILEEVSFEMLLSNSSNNSFISSRNSSFFISSISSEKIFFSIRRNVVRLHDQNKSGFFEGLAFIQPIKAI